MKNVFVLLATMWLTFCTTAWAAPLNVDTITGEHALRQNLMWLADPANNLAISDVSSGKMQAEFISLQNGFPVKSHSPIWLHLVLTKGTGSTMASAPLRLNIGDVQNNTVTIFRQHTDTNVLSDSEWWSEKIAPHTEYMLPMPGTKPVHIYIKMEDTPGLWFNPVITKQKTTQNELLPLSTFLQGIFILGVVGNILRALVIHRAWPIWAAIFLGLCLMQVSLPMPLLSKSLSLWDLPILIAPGLALIILPHLGRQLLQTYMHGGWADRWLLLFHLMGLGACLIPFWPQTVWVSRLAPLWPLLTTLLLPVAIWSLATKQSNARIFSLLCLLPALGALFALLALLGYTGHPAAPSAAFWGLAIAGITLCFAKQDVREQPETAPEIFNIIEELEAFQAPQSPLAMPKKATNPLELAEQKTIAPESLKPAAPLSLPEKVNYATDGFSLISAEPSKPQTVLPREDFFMHKPDISLKNDLTLNLPSKDKHDNVISLVDEAIAHEYTALQNQSLKLIVPEKNLSQRIVPFELEALVQNVCQTVLPIAEQRGIRFSWHITPNTPSYFIGEAVALQQVLFLILQNAVRAIQNGDVELAIRANCHSGNTCTLVCSISDSGGAGRREAGMQHAWNLAARSSGSFSLEYSPNIGSVLSFSMILSVPDQEALESETAKQFTAPDLGALLPCPTEDDCSSTEDEKIVETDVPQPQDSATTHERPEPEAVPQPYRILVADMTTSSRHLVTNYLSSLPCELLEAREAEHVGFVYGRSPVDLIIFDGSMPEADIALSIEAVRQMEESNTLPPAHIIALATHEPQGQRLLDMGCTSILYKPFSKEELVAHVTENLPAEHLRKHPVHTPEVTEPVDEGMDYLRRLLGDHNPPSRPAAAPAKASIKATANLQVPYESEKSDMEHNNYTRATADILPETINKILLESRLDSTPVTAMGPLTTNDDRSATATEKNAEEDVWKFWENSPVLNFQAPPAKAQASTNADEIDSQHSANFFGKSPFAKKDSSGSAASYLDINTAAPKSFSNKEEVTANTSLLDMFVPDAEEVMPPKAEPAEAVQHAEAPKNMDTVHSLPLPEVMQNDVQQQGTITSTLQSSIPLYGIEGEALDQEQLPLIPGFVSTMADTMREALIRQEAGETIMVQHLTAKLAAKAESFGLNKLSKLANCVERAAEADDIEAVETLLDDLAPIVQKYSDSLNLCYKTYLNDR